MGSDTGSLALDVIRSANTYSNASFVPDPVVGGAEDIAMTMTLLALPSWGSRSTGETDKSPHSDVPEWVRLGWGSPEQVLGSFQERAGRASWRRGPPAGM